jgi:hypothetical protein
MFATDQMGLLRISFQRYNYPSLLAVKRAKLFQIRTGIALSIKRRFYRGMENHS